MSSGRRGGEARPQAAARSPQPDPVLRPLTADDIPAAMALVRQVGWNQTPSDWRRFLTADPDGCFAATVDARVVGTVATIVYEGVSSSALPAETPRARRQAWIGMVIVDAQHRGKGLGARLLSRALEHLDEIGIPCVKLDATPLGRELYGKQGFVVELDIERWELVRGSIDPASRLPPPESSSSIDEIIALDSRLFGANRGELLRSIAEEAPDLTMALRADGRLIGYGCGRRGTRADHLGPWMARDASAAEQLLRTFLDRSTRPLVFVDVLKDNPWSSRLAAAHGFRVSRPLTRMYRGASSLPSDVRSLGAAIGPEFG